jgi:hypothetical protein
MYFLWYVNSQHEYKHCIILVDKIFYEAGLFSNFLSDDGSMLEPKHVA